MTKISLLLHNVILEHKKKLPNFSEVFLILMLGFFELEYNVLSKLLVVLSEFELFSCCEVLLLYVSDVTHDS